VWQEAAQPLIDAGKLKAIGVVQEQHPDRARLYKQWRNLSWPILVDSLNLLGLKVVPVPLLVDESGRVVAPAQGRTVEEARRALEQFVGGEKAGDGWPHPANAVDIDEERKLTCSEAMDWDRRGTLEFIHGDGSRANLDAAAEAFAQARDLRAKDARLHFRHGVALRRRADTPDHDPEDAQAAVAAWQAALQRDPAQYIWRRRIQQYGPRLDKPYNFYFWVEQAKRDITARGATPVALRAEPRGSEIAEPRGRATGAGVARLDPDPDARLPEDQDGVIAIESLVTPARVQPGKRVRVRVTFRPRAEQPPYWNNEAEGLQLSVTPPEGWSVVEGQFDFPKPTEEETRETRVLEFELQVPADAAEGAVELPAYACYDVCKESDGVCIRLRRSIPITVTVDPAAVAIGK
jgi:hypothetical protein